MTKEPTLGETKWTEDGDRYTMRVFGGLHMIRGNSKPYFSLTHWTYRNGREDSGGAGHREILKRFPQFADLAALHLSDIDGVPMHADSNGWYNLAGCYPDAFGEQYHRGNSKMQIWKPDGSFDGYRLPTGDECLAMFAEHCRIGMEQADAIRLQIQIAARAARSDRKRVAKERLAEIMATMRPRWKNEARACIARHGLKVYGDPWTPPQE